MKYCYSCYDTQEDTKLTKCELCDDYCCDTHTFSIKDNNKEKTEQIKEKYRCETCYYEKCHECGENANLICEKCDKILCSSHFAISACQTTWCICPNCYDYKCSKCRNDLNHDYHYLVDIPEYEDLCDNCYDHKCFDCGEPMSRAEVEDIKIPYLDDKCAKCNDK